VPTNLVWNLTGTNLLLSWPADHTGWRLLMQTNHLDSGISRNTNDWTAVPASELTNNLWLPIDQVKHAGFYKLSFP